MDLEGMRERWLAEKPVYEEYCERIKKIIEEETRRFGIACAVNARAKEVASFLKKTLRKSYSDPYKEINDKAGVRVICTYLDSLPQLEEIIRNSFTICNYENKNLGLEYDQLGYLGVHFEVSLPDKDIDLSDKHKGLICEIQIHTRAQNLWADISHELSYKPSQPPPVEVKRAIYRSIALVEIFDKEISQARRAILKLPGFSEANMLNELEKHYYYFTAKRFDRELSFTILAELQKLMSNDEIEAFEELIKQFVERNNEKLAMIFNQYANDQRCNPLLFQPESLLIFDRLEKDVFRLKETWANILPLELLESLAEIWGRPI